jgi:hypothetical protein
MRLVRTLPSEKKYRIDSTGVLSRPRFQDTLIRLSVEIKLLCKKDKMADDVQWLRSQGGVAEKSFMFLVDSSMRDQTAWPTPSEYVVTLPMPLRNVCAVDLVDATIPRTEYSVERD